MKKRDSKYDFPQVIPKEQVGLEKLLQSFPLPDVVSLSTEEDSLVILDQTQLPAREVFLKIDKEEELTDAILRLKVRGAPAIGVAAAAGLYVCFARTLAKVTSARLMQTEFLALIDRIRASRPTAVNLSWALDRMTALFKQWITGKNEITPAGFQEIKTLLRAEAVRIKEEDMEMCKQIARHGVELISPGSRILTHCNAGHLAVSRYGTALAPIYLAQACGLNPKVYADETRPLLQGARLTAYELMKFGVDTTLLCDNMAASLMSQGMIDMIMVGCDRIAANGDVANKIGTCGLAVLAHYYKIPFYVLGPTSTFDPHTPTGKEIVIEQRDASEVTDLHYVHRMAPEHVGVYNPAFDITPAALVTAYVTEKGVFCKPDFIRQSQSTSAIL